MHNFVTFSGSVVDVGKLLSQLKRSEKARSDTEANLKSALKNVHDLKEASEKHTSVKDKLQVRFSSLLMNFPFLKINFASFSE